MPSELVSTVIGATIAGGIGILTAWWIESRQRQTIRRTLAASLTAELVLIRHAMQTLADNKPADDDIPARVGQLRSIATLNHLTYVFDQNVDKIGLLDWELTQDLIHFYDLFKQKIDIGANIAEMSDENANGEDYYTRQYLSSAYRLPDGIADLLVRLERYVPKQARNRQAAEP